MSQDDGADSPESRAPRRPISLPSLVYSVVQDCLTNIVHEVVMDTHRSEKILRMQSAATQVSILAANQQLVSPANETPTKASSSFGSSQKGKTDTEGATWIDGVITLKGNPLETTKQIFCPQCRLPRLVYPLSGIGSKMPDDVNADYCKKHPFVTRQGHDVYGQPFPTDMAKTKKEKELIKQQQRAEKDSTPASQNSGPDGKDDEMANGLSKLAPQGKGANYIPWHTCPKCKRSLLITRFAQHLEKCMGISGRSASRNAMAKMSGQNGSIGSTPMGSRPSSPGPASQSEPKGQKRDREEDDADELDDVPLKKMKRRGYIKKADRERMAADSQASTSSAPSTQGPEKEKEKEKDKGLERESIKLKIKAPSSSAPSKEKEGTPTKRPPKPGGLAGSKDKAGDSAADETPTKKTKRGGSDN